MTCRDRPKVTTSDVSDILRQHYNLHVVQVTELVSYDCRNFSVTTVDAAKRANATADDEKKYVLKVMSDLLCGNVATTRKQIECSQFLRQRGFACPIAIPTIQGELLAEIRPGSLLLHAERDSPSADSPHSLLHSNHATFHDFTWFAELMTFLPGKQLGEDPRVISTTVLYELGVLLALMHQTLQEFNSDDLPVNPQSPWALENMHLLSEYIHCIQDEELKERLSGLITTFTEIKSGTEFKNLHKGIIHGDFHNYNLIVDWADSKNGSEQPPLSSHKATLQDSALKTDAQLIQTDQTRLEHETILQKYAIIDFEDVCYSYPVLELARLVADAMMDCQQVDLMDIGGHVIAGYMSVNSVPVKQFHYLYETALTCLAQFIILKSHAIQVRDEVNDYISVGLAPALNVLDKLKGISGAAVYDAWAAVLRTYKIESPFPVNK